ncbi:MAG: hypothetical protein COW00_02975 [Bdellovibrio sp. CG12_big_fil_rev_8_21_14_0_65_39_13]|nr:MAG: hypothetical protein COW78_13505 [Bdellovibrio sp. CG22_combo_CG10-13_8_21_14_all_39_27]PIQ61746.1 MAG: hypothetical protein COW00_02975 [Bdellovibrio sp. CG12_big_fil_rev_8_21_14_0_65_39_13]PIR34894.1 MAG: hypothetical protein COV37_11575 [Bdellovibrio sp. CG11_big_fil_rev_8_21_14_0_20_39_38]PJB54273.1 MAG: hypothetical protein CO099_02535 [Bdellovibrio sp. CG_4_9_14_3_um_filter_39_7]
MNWLLSILIIISFSAQAKEVSIDFDFLSLQGQSSKMTGRLIARKFFIDADGDHVLINQEHKPYDSELVHERNRLFFKSDSFLLSTPFEMDGPSTLDLKMLQGQFLSTRSQFTLNAESVDLKEIKLKSMTFHTSPSLLEDHNKLAHLISSMQINIDRLDTYDQKMILVGEDKSLIEINDLSQLELKMTNGQFQFKGKIKLLTKISFKVSGFAQLNSHGLLINLEKASIASIIPAKSLVIFMLKKMIDREVADINDDQILIKLN